MMYSLRAVNRLLLALRVFSFFSLFLVSAALHATPSTDWLLARQAVDGSFSSDATDLTRPAQSTAEALRLLGQQGLGSLPRTLDGYHYLSLDPDDRTEMLSLKILSAVELGVDVSGMVEVLLTRQGRDGGFAGLPDDASTLLDTAYALSALRMAGRASGVEIEDALWYVADRVEAGGYWRGDSVEASIHLTAAVLEALSGYAFRYGLSAIVSSGEEYLLRALVEQGPSLDVQQTSRIVLALNGPALGRGEATAAAATIESRRMADGGWAEGVYATALAARALLHARAASTMDETGVVINGVVTDLDVGSPLSGVSVAVSGSATGVASTDPTGYYEIRDLPPGVVEVTATLDGFITGSVSTSIQAGVVKTLDIRLAGDPTPTDITFTGTVVDALSGTPVEHARVALAGSTVETWSAADGGFRIDGVAPGNYVVEVIADGFGLYRYAIDAPAGGPVELGVVGLYVQGVGAMDGVVHGIVLDAVTRLPIRGVEITLSGHDTVATFTDVDGGFLFTGILPGAVTINATREGYRSGALVVDVEAGVVTETSVRMVKRVNPVAVTVQGRVVDAITAVPLEGVTITASDDSASGVTNGAGEFALAGVTAGFPRLNVSKTGYAPVSFGVDTTSAGVIDLGDVTLIEYSPPPPETGPSKPDLTVTSIDLADFRTNTQTLQVSGNVSVTVVNIGDAAAILTSLVTLFEDLDGDRQFSATADNVLGTRALPPLPMGGGAVDVTIPVSGGVRFRDSQLFALVDSGMVEDEANESNNLYSTLDNFRVDAEIGTLEPALKWHWSASEVAPLFSQVMSAPVVVQTNDDNGDGAIDSNDVPDVVFIAYKVQTGSYSPGILRIVSGLDGRELAVNDDPSQMLNSWGSVAAGDIDGDGVVEIVGSSSLGGLIAFENDGSFKWRSSATDFKAGWDIGAPSIADLDGDGSPEIIHGNTALRADGSLYWRGEGSFIGSNHPYSTVPSPHSIVADIDLDGAPEVIAGGSAYSSDGQLLWQNAEVRDGFTAVANLNDDPYAEVVLVAWGSITALDYQGRILWGPVVLPGGGWGNFGGAPTVADMDGDGLPEIGVAGGWMYYVFNHDGSLLWSSTIQDYSSAMTGSSVFDFDGDGLAEVVYGDEHDLWIYRGGTGEVLHQIPNFSGTAYELPVVADVDGDGHADIVAVSNQYHGYPGSTNGVRVFSAADDRWLATRGLWNQHSYHVTNIRDDGTIPAVEQNSWELNNTYRLNAFLDGRATALHDLTISVIRVEEGPEAGSATVTVRVGNGGNADTPEHAAVALYQGDPQAGGLMLGERAVGGIAADGFRDVEFHTRGLNPSGELYVVADAADRIEEIRESNNVAHLPLLTQFHAGSITVTTDAAFYGAQRQVAVSLLVTNESAVPGEFLVGMSVEDAAGHRMASWPPVAIGVIPGNGVVDLPREWNTGASVAGEYRVRGVLVGLDGEVIDEDVAPFSIGHGEGDGPAARLDVTTDRPIYHTTDRVAIELSVVNQSINTPVREARVAVEVRDPGGETLHREWVELTELVVGGERHFTLEYPFSAAAEGEYLVYGELTGSGGVVAEGQATYVVREDLARALAGSAEPAAESLYQGETQHCRYTLGYTGSGTAPLLPFEWLLLAYDSGAAVERGSDSVALLNGEARQWVTPVATAGHPPGLYACVLRAEVDGRMVTLAHGDYRLLPPPIDIASELNTEGPGRLLVLLDEPLADHGCRGEEDEEEDDRRSDREASGDRGNGDRDDDRDEEVGDEARDGDHDGHDEDDGRENEAHADGCDLDPLGPRVDSPLSIQRGWLERRLDAAGWSYTIVTDADDFSREQRGGGYTLYLLASETHHLDVDTQKALREALYGGHGLVVVGDHDRRNGFLDHPLGIALNGTHRADGITLAGGETLPFAEPHRVIRVHRLDGVAPARFAPGDEPAMTHRVYGEGEATYIAFDLLAEAALPGALEAWGELLLGALAEVSPVAEPPVAGGVLALHLVLTNQGVTTPGEARLRLPEGVSLLDGGEALLDGPAPRWPFALAEDEILQRALWLRLPEASAPLTFTALLDTGVAPDLVPYDETSWTLEVAPAVTLAEAQTLVEESGLDRNTRRQVERDLQRAADALVRNDPEDAWESLLKAADRLLSAPPEAAPLRLAIARLIGTLRAAP